VPPQRLLVPAFFATLVLATIGAFAHAQRVKHRDPLLDRARVTRDFSPNDDGRRDVAYVRFRLTRDDRATVEIVDDAGQPVRTLARDKPLRDYRYWVFTWNGRNEAGRLMPAGTYRLRVLLLDQDRDLVPPREIHLRHLPPVPAGPVPPA
jgi:hypothetical protein